MTALDVELTLTAKQLLLLLSIGVFSAMVIEGLFGLVFYGRHIAKRESAWSEVRGENAELKAQLAALRSKGVDHGD